MIEDLKPLIGKLSLFAKKRMGFERPPRLFLKNDASNAEKALGKTAYYDPNEESVTLFISNRHPKDILRSLAHELVHHTQNLRGDLSPEKLTNMSKNYAQDDDHMRNMEKEAYLQGNMCFRDWEDGLDNKELFIIKLAESKFLKENKTMTKKITKDFLRETIKNVLKGMVNEDVTAKFSDAEKSSIRNSKSRVDAERKAKALLMRKGMSSGAAARAAAQVARAHSFYGVSDEPGIAGMQRKAKADKAARMAAVKDKTILKFLDKEPGDDDNDDLFSSDNVKKAFASATDPRDIEAAQRKKDAAATQARIDRINQQGRSVAVKPGETPAMARAREDEEERRRKGMVAPEKPATPGTGLKEEEELEEAGCVPKKVDDEKQIGEGKKCCGMKGCPGPGEPHSGKYAIQENEELEEAGVKNPGKYKTGMKAGYDRDGDGVPNGADSDPDDGSQNESKIQTPEQEKTLYEQRFTPKNERLYQKLLKEWAK